MKTIRHSGGAIEKLPDAEELALILKHKGKKKKADFTRDELDALIIKLAQNAGLV